MADSEMGGGGNAKEIDDAEGKGETTPLLDGEKNRPVSDAEKEMQKPSLGLGDVPLLLFSSQGLILWSVTFSTYVPLLGYYGKEYGLSAQELGMVSAALQVAWLLVLPALPRIVSAIGGKRVVLFGLGIFAASSIPFVVSPNFLGLCATRAIEGIGSAVLLPVCDAVLTRQLSPETKGQGFGYRGAIAQLGKVFGLIVSVWLHPLGGLELTLCVISAFTVVAMLSSACTPTAWFVVEMNDKSGMWRCFTHDRLPFYVLHGTQWFCTAALFLALPLHFVDGVNLSMFEASAFWFCSDVAGFLAGLVGGWLADAYDPRHIVIWWSLGSGIVALVLAMDAHYITDGRSLICIVMAFLFSVCRCVISPSFAKIVTAEEIMAGVAPEELWASLHFVCTSALVLGSLATGCFYTAFGFGTVLAVSGALLLASTIYFAWATSPAQLCLSDIPLTCRRFVMSQHYRC